MDSVDINPSFTSAQVANVTSMPDTQPVATLSSILMSQILPCIPTESSAFTLLRQIVLEIDRMYENNGSMEQPATKSGLPSNHSILSPSSLLILYFFL